MHLEERVSAVRSSFFFPGSTSFQHCFNIQRYVYTFTSPPGFRERTQESCSSLTTGCAFKPHTFSYCSLAPSTRIIIFLLLLFVKIVLRELFNVCNKPFRRSIRTVTLLSAFRNWNRCCKTSKRYKLNFLEMVLGGAEWKRRDFFRRVSIDLGVYIMYEI